MIFVACQRSAGVQHAPVVVAQKKLSNVLLTRHANVCTLPQPPILKLLPARHAERPGRGYFLYGGPHAC